MVVGPELPLPIFIFSLAGVLNKRLSLLPQHKIGEADEWEENAYRSVSIER
ncbi:MAG: hypothetical protein ACE5GK_01635 [Nitrospiria bacterium]